MVAFGIFALIGAWFGIPALLFWNMNRETKAERIEREESDRKYFEQRAKHWEYMLANSAKVNLNGH